MRTMASSEPRHAERPGLRRWTRDEYGRLLDHGFLDEDDPIELLDGLLFVKEPQHSRHRTAVLLVAKALERAFGAGWFVQTQSPIILDGRSEPEPDVCVVRGSPRDYVAARPTRPALVVEVAQSGLALARGRPRRSRARSPSRARATGARPRALGLRGDRDARRRRDDRAARRAWRERPRRRSPAVGRFRKNFA